MSVDPNKNPLAQAEAIFRRLLARGKPVTFEDASRSVVTLEGFDRRSFGSIPLRMMKAGEIIEAGFSRGRSSKCNKAIKRLWIAAPGINGGAK